MAQLHEPEVEPAPEVAPAIELLPALPDETIKPGKKPWNPTLLPLLAFLFSFAASGILAGINWRRLGQPRWTWPTIIGSIVAMLAILWFLMTTDASNSTIGYAVNVGIGTLFMLWQKAAYRRWLEEHPEAQTWKSGWAIPAAVSIGSLALVVLVAFGLTAASMAPTFAAIDHFNRGVELGQKEEWAAAIEEYTQALQQDDKLAEAYLNRGHAYTQQSKWKAALADFDKAIALDPNLEVAYRNRGLVYAVLGEAEKAMTDAHQAVKMDPADAKAYWLCGLLHADQREKAEAKADLEQAIALGLEPDMKQTAEEALQQLQ